MRFRIEPVRLTLADAVVDPASWALTVRKSGWRDSAGVFGPEDSFDGVSSKGRRGRGRRTRGESAIVYGRLLELTATVRESDAVGLELFRSSISFQYMTGQSRASLAKRIAQRLKKRRPKNYGARLGGETCVSGNQNGNPRTRLDSQYQRLPTWKRKAMIRSNDQLMNWQMLQQECAEIQTRARELAWGAGQGLVYKRVINAPATVGSKMRTR